MLRREPILGVYAMVSEGPRGVGVGLVGHLSRRKGRVGEVVIEASRVIAGSPDRAVFRAAIDEALALVAGRGEIFVDIFVPVSASTVRSLRATLRGDAASLAEGVDVGRPLEQLRIRHLGRRKGRRARARTLARMASGAESAG